MKKFKLYSAPIFYLMQVMGFDRKAHMKFELKTIAGTPAVLMCLQDVQVRTTLSRSSIYRLMNENVFPRSIALSQHRVAWLASEVDAFIAGRVTASRVAQDRSFEGQQ